MVLDLTELPKGATMVCFLQKVIHGTTTWHSTALAKGYNSAAVAGGMSELPGDDVFVCVGRRCHPMGLAGGDQVIKSSHSLCLRMTRRSRRRTRSYQIRYSLLGLLPEAATHEVSSRDARTKGSCLHESRLGTQSPRSSCQRWQILHASIRSDPFFLLLAELTACYGGSEGRSPSC